MHVLSLLVAVNVWSRDPSILLHNATALEGSTLSGGLDTHNGSMHTSAAHDATIRAHVGMATVPDPMAMGCRCTRNHPHKQTCECCHAKHTCARDQRCTWVGHFGKDKRSLGTQCQGPTPTVTDDQIMAADHPFGCKCSFLRFWSQQPECGCCHYVKECDSHVACFWMPESWSKREGIKSCKDRKIIPSASEQQISSSDEKSPQSGTSTTGTPDFSQYYKVMAMKAAAHAPGVGGVAPVAPSLAVGGAHENA